MRIDFLNVDKLAEELPSIVSNKIFVRKEYHIGGLFSQKIFGPVKNYTCGCGNYMGRSKVGTICEICGIKIAHSNERRKRFAKIPLPFPILNPIMYYILEKVGKTTLKDIIHNLIFSETIKGYYWNKKMAKYIPLLEEEEVPEGITLYSGLDGAYEIIKKRVEKEKTIDPDWKTNPDWKFIYDNMDKFYINNVIVNPPAFRPTSKTKDVQKRDQLNDMFMTILNFTLTSKNEELLDIKENPQLYAIQLRHLQRYVFNLYEFVLSKFSKKSGIIRNNILGKRVDFSGRAVIAPDPVLSMDYCKVPYYMLLELYKLEIASALYEQKKVKTAAEAITLIDDCIKKESFELFDVVKKVCNNKPILLNRQPTLHRMGILGFKVIPNKEFVIQIHPLYCDPFNADFDGDQMAIYRPLYKDAEDEILEKLLFSKNLISPTTGELIAGVNQDIVLGIYCITKDMNLPDVKVALIKINGKDKIVKINEDEFKNNKKKITSMTKSIITMKEGMWKFFKCLPFQYKRQFILHKNIFNATFNKPVTKKFLNKILDDIVRSYPNDIIVTLDNIKRLGLYETTRYGNTISLKGMKIKNVKKITEKIFDDDNLSISEKINKFQSDDVMDIVKKNFTYSDFIESGSRGSWDQAKQIILARGFISDSKGNIIEEPIRNNYVNGLKRSEYFSSSYGTRKGLLDTALNTGVSGYLTRKIIYSTSNLELNYNDEDCGTKDVLKILIPGKIKNGITPLKFCKSLIGRYYIEDEKIKEITLTNYYKLAEKAKKLKGLIINLRSPIFCTHKKICKTCYGKNSEVVKSPYVGIIAAQALGEVGTQLVLRTFHTSGIAQSGGDDDDGKQEDIISDLSAVCVLLHHSDKNIDYIQTILDLYKIYSKHRNIMLVHFECIVSQMMRVKKVRWRLIKERNLYEPELVSILNVPQRESWLLALAFHRPKDYIIKGILNSEKQDGILEKIMTNQKI